MKKAEKQIVKIVDQSSQELLEGKGLKKTKLRMELMQHFKNARHAQSYGDLKKVLVEPADKSTLYRNLSIFEEVGLIHSINDHTGTAKYALGASPSSGHEHAHFVCENCENVYCVKGMPELQLEVPTGFRSKNIHTIIRGICANC
ncbi:Fur family transcriptional regulator [Flagellimonas onchidii]|uniref:Fur family transcriptional regulator n=1 Tax=Flagellimonas onchidii TaxID=2562684 RepID=UPI0010A6B4E8|nr:transcriptional repressor [Allomuricauda onchidii]